MASLGFNTLLISEVNVNYPIFFRKRFFEWYKYTKINRFVEYNSLYLHNKIAFKDEAK